jgi:hypothetical protein
VVQFFGFLVQASRVLVAFVLAVGTAKILLVSLKLFTSASSSVQVLKLYTDEIGLKLN